MEDVAVEGDDVTRLGLDDHVRDGPTIKALPAGVLAEEPLDPLPEGRLVRARDQPEGAGVSRPRLEVDQELDAADVGAVVMVPAGVGREAGGDRCTRNGRSSAQLDRTLVQPRVVGDEPLAEPGPIDSEGEVVTTDAAGPVLVD